MMQAKLFFLSVLMGLSSVAATLTVSNIEVNQAIQTTTNTITPFVAGRGTTVRATLAVTSPAAPVVGISGRLHIFVSGVEITPIAGLLPINAPFTAVVAPNRTNQNDTLNFEIPAGPAGIPASAAVTFRVDPTVAVADTAVSLTTPNITFVSRTAPLLYFTRINYTPSGLGLPDILAVQPGVGDAFVRGILPVDESTPTLYQQGLFPTLGYSGDANGDGILEALAADGNNLISLLASCRQLIVNSGVGASDRIFLYGWLNGNPINGNGLGQVGGRNAFGNTQGIRYQRSYAHELMHNFGFDHNPGATTIGEVGWDTGARLVGNPATNSTTTNVKPGTLRDIMDGGLVTNQAWIHPNQSGACGGASCVSYQQLLGSPTLAPDSAGDFSTDVLVVQGIFDPTGERLLQLKPAFRYPWRSQPTQLRKEQQSRYAVRVVTANAQVTVPFNPYVADDGEKNAPAVFGFFEVMVPVSGVVRSISITDIGGTRTFGAIEGGQQAPSVQIVTPVDGTRLGRIATVVAKLASGAGTNIMYQAAYSPDGGKTFVPIAVDLKEPNFSFDATAVQSSAGQGLIRVFVSDGLNTAFADVTKLTTPGMVVDSVLNAASYKGNGVSPGEIITIFGLGIGPAVGEGLKLTPAGLVDTTLGGTRVLFDGQPGPMIYASDRQVSAVVPYGIAGKSRVNIEVEYLGGKTDPVPTSVNKTYPGIFTLNASGTGPGAILNDDFRVNSATTPAARGNVVAVYATGEGVTNPPSTDGKPGTVPLPLPVLPVTASVGGQSADVLFAGTAPGLVAGVIQVNVRIPAALTPGTSVPIILNMGGVSSQSGVTVAVR